VVVPHLLTIEARDDSTEALLPGACYDILDQSEETVASACDSDNDGVQSFRLPPGTYYPLVEQPPAGYESIGLEPINLTDEMTIVAWYPLTVTPTVEVTVTLTVGPTPGSITVGNYAEDESILPGACFAVSVNYSEPPFVTICDRPDGDFADGSPDGYVVFKGLSPGDYVVWESEAPPGYLPLTEAPSVNLNEGQEIGLSFYNTLATGTVVVALIERWSEGPLPGRTFTLYGPNQEVYATGVTDEAGIIRFEGLPPSAHAEQQYCAVMSPYEETEDYYGTPYLVYWTTPEPQCVAVGANQEAVLKFISEVPSA
jgi:hypothetical protein